MKKKSLLLFTTIILLACNFLFPPASTPERLDGEPTESFSQTNPSDELSREFTIVRLHPDNGDLQPSLAKEAHKAAELDQMPVVEFDATWCPPCQAIDKGLKSRNELMLKAYEGMYIIKLDVDEWGWGNSKLHDFQFDGIPVYFKLDPEGNQTGEVIDGGAWGEDIPENIAPVMDTFFHNG